MNWLAMCPELTLKSPMKDPLSCQFYKPEINKKKLNSKTIMHSVTETLAEKTSSGRIEISQTMTPAYGNTICPHQYNILIHNTYPHTHILQSDTCSSTSTQ